MELDAETAATSVPSQADDRVEKGEDLWTRLSMYVCMYVCDICG
jgi:hypothetical protein